MVAICIQTRQIASKSLCWVLTKELYPLKSGLHADARDVAKPSWHTKGSSTVGYPGESSVESAVMPCLCERAEIAYVFDAA